jgi:hypothetical protein
LSAQRVHTAVNLGFVDRSRYFSFKEPEEAEWTPFQTRCFSENLIAPGIDPRPVDLFSRNSDHQTTEAVILVTYIT